MCRTSSNDATTSAVNNKTTYTPHRDSKTFNNVGLDFCANEEEGKFPHPAPMEQDLQTSLCVCVCVCVCYVRVMSLTQ